MQRSLSANYGQQHPGTSLGYDVGPDQNGSLPGFPAATRTWQQQQQQQLDAATSLSAVTMAQSAPRRGPPSAAPPSASAYAAHHAPNSHSFRDPGQSFRVPPSAAFPSAAASVSSPTTTHVQQQQQLEQFQFQQQRQQPTTPGGGQSFLSPVDVSAPSLRPSSSSGGGPTATAPPGSRPPTAGGASQRTPLPPFAAVVAHSLAPSQHRPPVLSVPADARRPGTAPAAYLSHRSFSAGGAPGGGRFGLVPLAELPLHASGRGGFAQHGDHQLGGSGPFGHHDTAGALRDYNLSGSSSNSSGFNPPSPPGAHISNESPFSFHPPSLAEARASSSGSGFERAGSSSSSSGSLDDDELSPFGISGGSARPPPTPSTAGGGPSTSTGASPGLSLAGSPSWTSSMTHHHPLQQQMLDGHFYPYTSQAHPGPLPQAGASQAHTHAPHHLPPQPHSHSQHPQALPHLSQSIRHPQYQQEEEDYLQQQREAQEAQEEYMRFVAMNQHRQHQQHHQQQLYHIADHPPTPTSAVFSSRGDLRLDGAPP